MQAEALRSAPRTYSCSVYDRSAANSTWVSATTRANGRSRARSRSTVLPYAGVSTRTHRTGARRLRRFDERTVWRERTVRDGGR